MIRPFTIVTWIDASDIESANGQAWFDEMELGKFAAERVVVRSAGWVWSDTKLYLTLVGDDIIDGVKKPTYGRITKIPKGMIVNRVDLDVPPAPLPADEAVPALSPAQNDVL